MAILCARLFGGLAVNWGETPLPPIAGAMARSLFAYLLTYRDRPHTRDLLAGTFWPELPESTARRRLSQALWQIRNALEPHPILLTEGDTVQWNPNLPLWLDTEEFAKHKEQGTRGEPGAIEHYELCLEHYKGEFLAGYYDDWIVVERERLREMLLDVLERLVAGSKRRGEYERALLHARRLAGEDPWREDAHREVMRLCHLLGRDSEALKQFKTCRQILAEELGAEPSSETVALAQELAQFSGDSLGGDLPATALPAGIVLDSAQAPELPLVGREAERAQLLTHVERLMRGSGGVVLLEGEAGVGKTRLLQTLAHDAEWRGAEVLWGAGREVEGAAPYGPLVEALSEGLTPLRVGQLGQLVEGIWLQVLAPLLPLLGTQLPDLLPPPALDPAQERDRLLAALARVLAGWAQITPLLLVLEDLHWAGEDTLDLLTRLAPGMGARGVLIVGSYRGAEARALPGVWERLQALDRAGVQHRLELAGLDADATAELVRRCLGMRSAAPFFEARLYGETKGNPLFVLETLRALHGEGLLTRDESGRWSTPWDGTTVDYAELPLPPAVEQTIARRLDFLSPALRRTIDLAALLGERFGFDLLRAAGDSEPQTLLAAVRQLVQRRFLDETEQDYRFSHDKIRQVAYDRIAESARVGLHRQVAQALEDLAPDQPAALAHHWALAGEWAQAVVYHQQAGDRAQAVYANAEAAQHYSQALAALAKLADDPQCKFALLLAREKVYHLLGEREAQALDLQALAELADTLDDNRRRADVNLRRAEYAVTSSDFPAAVDAARQAIHLSQAVHNQQSEATAHFQLGRAFLHLGNHNATRSQYERALELARAISEPSIEAKSLQGLGILCRMQGEYAEARRHQEQALEIWRQVGDRYGEGSVIVSLALIVDEQGEYAEARGLYEQVLDIWRALGHRDFEAVVLNNLGLTLRKQRDLDAARTCYQQALRINREVGNRFNESSNIGSLAAIFRAQGYYAQALQADTQSLHIKQEIGALIGIARSHGSLGQEFSHLGNYLTARSHTEQALSIFRKLGDHRGEALVFEDLSLISHHLGDDQAALEYGQQALHLWQELGSADSQGEALVNVGRAQLGLGRLSEAATAFQQALDLLREGKYYLVMEPVAGLASAALAQGDLGQAQAHIEQILAYLENHIPDGAYDPFWLYLTCYQVLEANGDSRAAEILRTAHDLLQERAARIDDEALRRSFLQNVATHRKIVAAYQAFQASPREKQTTVLLPHADAPQGRPLRDDEYVSVTWTLATAEDASLTNKVDRRRRCLLRLLHEAQAQGAIPRDLDLANALGVSLATLRRDLATLRDRGYDLPPRRRRK
jgi:DNA-binding SARP family transcriptional activator/Tfp pilus assembly protein PilF